MTDIFVDIEFTQSKIFLLGAHCPGVTSDTNRFQLYGRELTPEKLIEFITQCSKPNKQTLLFCHGPDFGHIEKRFGINLKDQYPCINVITAYKRFTRFKCKSLGHLAHTLQLGKWRNPIPTGRVGALWKTRTATDRRQVLDYNWDDCVILSNAVSHLRQGRRPAVKSKDFIDSARL